MSFKETIEVINALVADGVIARYAIAGAFAALNYVEPTETENLDILVDFGARSDRSDTGLIVLEPVFAYLRAKGYREHRKEGLFIEGWPVQFLPVADDLDRDALVHADEIEVRMAGGSVRASILRAEHVVAIALRTGRPKDLIRIAQFLDEEAVDVTALCGVLTRHAQSEAWRAYCRRTGTPDPCAVQDRQ